MKPKRKKRPFPYFSTPTAFSPVSFLRGFFNKLWKSSPLAETAESSPTPSFRSRKPSPRISTPDSWFLKFGAGPIYPSLYVVNPSPGLDPELFSERHIESESESQVEPEPNVPATKAQRSHSPASSLQTTIKRYLQPSISKRTPGDQSLHQMDLVSGLNKDTPRFLCLTPEKVPQCPGCNSSVDILAQQEDISLLSCVLATGFVAQYSRRRSKRGLRW